MRLFGDIPEARHAQHADALQGGALKGFPNWQDKSASELTDVEAGRVLDDVDRNRH